MRILGLTILAAACTAPGPDDDPTVRPTTPDTPPTSPTDTGEPPTDPPVTGIVEEHAPDEPPAVLITWGRGFVDDVPLGPRDKWEVTAQLRNDSELTQRISLFGHGDDGSGGATVHTGFGSMTLERGITRNVPITFDGLLPRAGHAHSGSLTVVVRSCPEDGSPCETGTLPTIYHHVDPASGELVLYDEAGLCARHRCGDVFGRGPIEPGTTRVVTGRWLPDLTFGEVDPTPPHDPTPSDIASNVANYDVCLAVDVLFSDAGQSPWGPGGLTEDRWANADDPSSYTVIARGFRAQIQGPGIDEVVDADPSTGCFTFQGAIDAEYDLRVWAYATDSAGNVFRVHDAGTDTSSWYPGATQSMQFVDLSLDPQGINNLVIDGRADDRWGVAAAGAYALYRFHDGASDRTISASWGDSCDSSGSIHGSAENYIESNNAHLLRIGRCAGSGSDTREKMIITHEMGHAMLRMHYGYDGDESPRDDEWDPTGDPALNLADPGNGKRCALGTVSSPSGSSYSMHTVEFNSQAFKEGYADWWSARVWNEPEEQAIYVYRSDAFDMETWDTFGWGLDSWGGFTTQWCEVTDPDDVSTKGDWQRFLWDVYTDPDCDELPSRLQIMDLYRAVRENHRTGDFELTTINYDQAMMHAIAESDLPQCARDRAQNWASWNGI